MMQAVNAVLRRDLRIETRTPQVVPGMALFWKKQALPIPLVQRTMDSGRFFAYGSSSFATAA